MQKLKLRRAGPSEDVKPGWLPLQFTRQSRPQHCAIGSAHPHSIRAAARQAAQLPSRAPCQQSGSMLMLVAASPSDQTRVTAAVQRHCVRATEKLSWRQRRRWMRSISAHANRRSCRTCSRKSTGRGPYMHAGSSACLQRKPGRVQQCTHLQLAGRRAAAGVAEGPAATVARQGRRGAGHCRERPQLMRARGAAPSPTEATA